MNHTPATPLPWGQTETYGGQPGRAVWAWAIPGVVADCQEAYAPDRDHGQSVQDAAYIAHAANSYPKLVDVLQSIAYEPIGDRPDEVTRSMTRWAHDVLKEIGEEL